MKLFFAMVVCLLSVKAFGFEIGPVGVYSSDSSTAFTTTGSANLSVTPDSASGYGGGLASSFPLGPHFNLEIDALYVSVATSASFTGSSSGVAVTGSDTGSAPYIQIPVLLDVKLGEAIGLHLGGYYAIATGNVSSTVKTTALGVTTTTTSSSTNNTNDYGAVGGLEFRANISSTTKLLISGDYFYGFANINANTSGYGSSTSKMIQAMAGVLFNL